ncbi:hypothetical protein [Paraglaciecola arctica]|uniref:hypothetical protein n=1 Tax=Paraglaciecola arctica TaxID=1128911 RepID=UPI001C065E58|nr:hypothetical protein [Paraglaciecola arctica]MBU3005584.1 hypothetical protein [Paraglaciecola arctica]
MNLLSTTIIYTLAIVLFLCGCTSIESTQPNPSLNPVTVTIYRDSALQGSLSYAYVGWDNKYYGKLATKQYTVFSVPEGIQEFRVKAHADVANQLTLRVSRHSSVCIMVQVNPENIVGVNWLVPSYELKQVECLSSQQIGTYEKV